MSNLGHFTKFYDLGSTREYWQLGQLATFKLPNIVQLTPEGWGLALHLRDQLRYGEPVVLQDIGFILSSFSSSYVICLKKINHYNFWAQKLKSAYTIIFKEFKMKSFLVISIIKFCRKIQFCQVRHLVR